jgi:asparagine synthase (glutamine-hydrolysing)
MTHSLEIRVPFADHKLIESLAGDIVGPFPFNKDDLTATPHSHLPNAVLRRPKTGFTIPIREWLADRFSAAAAHQRWAFRGSARYVYEKAVA